MVSSKAYGRYEYLGSNGSSYRSNAPRTQFREQALKLTALLAVLLFLSFFFLYGFSNKSTKEYGLMIDAGSTGSRIHTFTFNRDASNNNNNKLKLLGEDFFAVKPGLSSYRDDHTGAKTSMTHLIERAKKIVPQSHWKTTPIYLKATAGLRQIGEEEAEKVLESVREVFKESGFRFDNGGWASILSGNDEGIFSWITVNYLMEKEKGETVGTLEMGGGSSQIAFVPRDVVGEKNKSCDVPEVDVKFRGDDVKLYTKSHARMGIKKAKQIVFEEFERMRQLIDNPCVNSGAVQMKIPFVDGKSLKMTGQGDFGKCRKAIDEIVAAKSAENECHCELCTYAGEAQPKPIPTYIAFAFYAERTVKLGLPPKLTVKDIRKKGEEVCGMSLQQVEKEFPNVANGKAEDLCFDLAFVTANLEVGHNLKEGMGTELLVLDKINGVELGWSLGAMFAEMSRLPAETENS